MSSEEFFGNFLCVVGAFAIPVVIVLLVCALGR